VKAYRETKALLMKDFFELVKLEGSEPATQTKHTLKEQEIGQHCYEAEADLNLNDLEWLKLAVGIVERKWQEYIAKYVGTTIAEQK
jgi:hypothetical protein